VGMNRLLGLRRGMAAVAEECGDPIPGQGSGGESGRFIARLPKSMHTRLAARAKQEGVSMNTLVVSIISKDISTYH